MISVKKKSCETHSRRRDPSKREQSKKGEQLTDF